jgi:hypothetical protein
VQTAVARRRIGDEVKRRAMSARHRTAAAAPSFGEQNMYWVSGWFSILDFRMSSSEMAARRNA